MKYSKRTIIAAAVVTTLTITGVAAAYSDVQFIPGKEPVKIKWAEPTPEPEPVVNPTIEETPVSDIPDNTSNPENQTPASAPPTQTNNETVVPNETPAPNPPAEIDLTPEPLPAPEVCQTCVSNPNAVSNDDAGTVRHN